MTRVKICGATSATDLDRIVAAGADAVGIIVDVPVDTPREVTAERAKSLIASVPPLVSSVLVTMPETAADAVELADRVQPDTVQLHGDLSPDAAAAVSARTPTTVIKAVDADDPDRCEAYVDSVDALLVDSVDASGGGGTGETHNWEQTREVVDALDTPVILAGGLTPENVAEAVETVRPFGVDVASGVERDDLDDESTLRKDPDAVDRFVSAAKTVRGRGVAV